MAAVAGVLLLYLVVFDVAVVAISFLLDIAPVRHKSTPLFYAIWFVAGVFCGFLVYLTAGGILSSDSSDDWTDREDAGLTGVLVILCTSVVLATLSILSYVFLWRGSTNSSYYVPDNAPLTLTFFVALLASTVLAHRTLRTDPKKRARPAKPGNTRRA